MSFSDLTPIEPRASHDVHSAPAARGRARSGLALLLTLCALACSDESASKTRDEGEVQSTDDSDDETDAGERGEDTEQAAGGDAGGPSRPLDASALDASGAGAREGGEPAESIDEERDASTGAESVADASGGAAGGGACTRESLKATIDAYFTALAAHEPAMLPSAANLKFTENAKVLELGQGLWTTAGAATFRRSLLDTERCGSLTQAVIEESGKEILFAVRLALVNQQITEVETFVVRSGTFFRPEGVKDDGGADWEGVLTPAERSTRETLNGIADAYFESFMDSSVEVPYDTPCKRFEGGLMPVEHCSQGFPTGIQITERRYPVADLEAGIAVGFVLFAGNLLDFHMFKIVNGKITGIQALVGPRVESSGWGEP